MIRLLRPPDFPDVDRRRRAAAIHGAGVAVIVLQAPLIVASLALGAPMGALIMGVLDVAAALALLLNHGGRIEAAGTLLATTMWSLVSLQLLMGPCPVNPAYPGLVAAVVLAAVAVGRRAALTIGAMSVASLSVGTICNALGLVPALPMAPPVVAYGASVSGLVLIVWLLGVSARSYQESIQEIRQAHRHLADAEENFRLLTENIREGMWVADLPSGRFRYVSPGVGTLLGVDPATVRSLSQLLHHLPADTAHSLPNPERWGDLPPEGRVWNFEIVREGDRRHLQLRAFPVATREHAGRTVVGVLDDVTAIRVAEKRVAEQERQMVRSQKVEALGRLAAGIAHDFNNLLTIIQLNARLAMDEVPEGSPAHQDMGELLEASQRAARLTDQLLAYSRQQVQALTALDVRAETARLLGLMDRLLGPEVTVEADIADDLPHALADVGQFEQVLTNLVLNARDAIAGRGAIRVGAWSLADDEGAWVRVTVSDDGVGMNEATRARIFEPFFTTKPPGQGTGLGLPMVLGIVEQTGGRITVDTAPGEGTTILVDLPAAPETPTPLPPRPIRTVSTDHRGRLLVVDDEPAVLGLVDRLLREAGYDVQTASSAEEALGVLGDATGVDLVVSDVRMPGRSGVELATAIHAQRPDLPILLMSGYAEDLLVDRPDGVGFLPKPLDIDRLLAEIARLTRS